MIFVVAIVIAFLVTFAWQFSIGGPAAAALGVFVGVLVLLAGGHYDDER